MDFWNILIAVVCGIAICQGLFLCVFIMVKSVKKFTPAIFLGMMLLGLTLRISKSYYYYLFDNVPFWAVMVALAGLWTIGPSFWLYTLSGRPSNLRKADYLHFGPAVLLLLSSFIADPDWQVVPLYKVGALVLAAYVAVSFGLFFYGNWQGNRKRFLLFGGSMAVVALIFIFQAFLATIQGYTVGTVLTLIVLYAINFMLLTDRKLLQTHGKYKKGPTIELDTIYQKITLLMEGERLYRKKGLTLADLAKELDYPVYLVSQAIKEHKGLQFNAFVNGYRVQEVKTQLEDLETNAKIEVIAKAVGFSSTASFYTAFKAQTQHTPQAYRKAYARLQAEKV
ncbi:helix-turn-helix domain-containing protein [Sediminicola luteus]|uniref:HTH araC/xylS-type domain-containing protein n=1 Tax=Sediminicola luteus TaxID=319238 RepID=A0A2A4G7P6_9FLAO|nr:AraC family transcriptional regulator [Sediminicola luteus]PCE63775.1 hypothetical protein B7P33_10905 [Sediminicola luteus]